jgi:X-Pro dipeptidyl-peptidase
MKPGRLGRRAVVAALTLVVAVVAPTALGAGSGPAPVVMGGVTQPVFGYADAIRERVWVESTFDSDLDGANDLIAMDIMRPQASETGDLKVPVIMDASPYYSTLGRGNEAELKQDTDGDGLLDKWPLFYDNYFVPRGYAVVLLDMVGTNNSTGCPVTGGTPDNLSAKVAIDWLNGRATARDKDGNIVEADWHNGRTGMIGKSYDGTLANAVAATGVEGLSTIVPISAISSWYDYTRSNGIVQRGNSYPSLLSNVVTNPDRLAYCAVVRATMAANDGDEHGDYTPFWAERDYLPDADKVTASVFVVHGTNDENVRPDHFSKWWYELKDDLPRKIWLTQTGHIDPFDFRRAVWVDTIHRWFDSELWKVKNGIRTEPEATIERSAGVFENYSHWPDAKMEKVELRIADTGPTTPGLLKTGPKPRGSDPSVYQTFQDSPTQSQTAMQTNLETVTANRRVFLTPPLLQDVRISGTPFVSLHAAADQVDTNVGALLVDWGLDTRVQWNVGDGIRTLTTEDCWGETSPADDPCYFQTETRTVTAEIERVTKGILDARNRNSLTTPEDLVPGEEYLFDFPLLPEDYIFKAGHRIAFVIVGSYPGYGSLADQTRANITVNLTETTLELPVVGGEAALKAAGL